MKHAILFLLFGFAFSLPLAGQSNFDYTIKLKSISFDGLTGLHSFAYGVADGRWVLIGGRDDGLHPRQPFRAFPAAHNNRNIFLVDPLTEEVITVSVDALPAMLNEQMQSTNMQFYQEGDHLILIGGYAFSMSNDEHITYPALTVINLPGLINDIQQGVDIAHNFRQIEHDFFAVTGGNLGKIGNSYYLVGGHRFDGAYNPMNMPTFIQEYTNAIRKFELEIRADTLLVSNPTEIVDPIHLHRRDYNLLPQIHPDGNFGYTIFSGVFQINQDLPFLYPVEITHDGYNPVTVFNQYLSNYHCGHFPLYDANEGVMHNLFFGGISQYFYDGETFIQNDDVPFVKTISRVSRDQNGVFEEVILPEEMPNFLGASAEFILQPDLPMAGEGIVSLSDLDTDTILIGHLVGGIYSEAMNPFSFNNTEATHPFDSIYQVFLMKSKTTHTEDIVLSGYHDFAISVNPNPCKTTSFRIEIDAPEPGKVDIYMADTVGNIFVNETLQGLGKGKNTVELELEKPRKGIAFLTATLNHTYSSTTKVVFQ